jgi:hypothetical protein
MVHIGARVGRRIRLDHDEVVEVSSAWLTVSANICSEGCTGHIDFE